MTARSHTRTRRKIRKREFLRQKAAERRRDRQARGKAKR